MKIKKVVTRLVLLISISIANAQEFKLGKVSIAELEQKEHPKDPSAVAAILFKKGEVRYDYSQDKGFEMITEVTTRIKIYKKEGYDWANQMVKYYIGGNGKETVSFSDAVTYNLVAGKIEKTKLKSDGEFDEKINKYWNRGKISMPNVKEGSVLEFQYTLRSPSIGSIDEWQFQTSIPVNYSEYKTYIPEYFIYNPNFKGFIFPKVTTEKTRRTVNFFYKEVFVAGGNNSTSQEKLEFEETQTTYLAENLPAMKEESYVNNINNYTSSLSNELSVVKYPNSPIKTYSTDWETVTKKIYDYDDFGLELKKTGYFEDDITALIKGLTNRDEIIATIFNYVKTSVKWDGYKSYFCSDGVKKAYKDKTGNVAEINLMLTAMLRFAGIDANPVLLSTRDNGIALFPNRTAFNYVIAAVEIQDALILLDATEKYALPNILPMRDLNWYGRLIRKDGTSTQVDLMSKSLSKEVSYMNIVLNPDNTIDGKLRKQYTDYEALEFRQKNISKTKDNYLEILENENNNIEISEYVRDNDLDLSKPIVENYSFKDTKSIEVISNKIYISPLLFLTLKENPFKQEKREYPVDFSYPQESKYYINITIPEGYVVETLPTVMNIATGDDIGAFKYAIGTTENKIQISVTFTINTAIVPADYYEVIKDFYQKMIDKQNEKIVLVKK
jgi:transglutaminase-like putative cysteine protease